MAKYEPVEDVRVSPDAPSSDLIELYGKEYGFMAGHLWRAAQVLAEGLKGSELRVLSFTGNLISTGLRGVITQLIRERLFNVVITTCGALDHDIARATGGKYLKGFFEADDVDLARHDMHRLGNVFIRVEDYGPRVEKFVRDLVARAVSEKEEWAPSELAPPDGVVFAYASPNYQRCRLSLGPKEEVGQPLHVLEVIDLHSKAPLALEEQVSPKGAVRPARDEDVGISLISGPQEAVLVLYHLPSELQQLVKPPLLLLRDSPSY